MEAAQQLIDRGVDPDEGYSTELGCLIAELREFVTPDGDGRIAAYLNITQEQAFLLLRELTEHKT